jgi:hypothetical protein
MVVWHVLTAREVDRQADVAAVARSLMTWGVCQGLAPSLGLSRPQFVRQQLDQLGAGHALEAFKYCGRTCRLPPSGPTSSQPGADP